MVLPPRSVKPRGDESPGAENPGRPPTGRAALRPAGPAVRRPEFTRGIIRVHLCASTCLLPAPRLHPEASEQIRRFILLSLQGSAPPGPEGPDAGRGGAGTPGPAQTAPLCSKTPPGSADAALHVTPEPGKHGGGHPVSVAAVPDPRLEAQRGIPSVLSGQWVRWVTVGRALVHSGRWLRAPSQRPRCARSSPPRCPLVLGPA